MLSLNETDSRLKETIWRQTKFQLKHAWSQKSQGDSHHSGPSQFSGTEQQLLWEVPVELLLWPSLNHAGHTTFHSLKDRATFHCPFLILFSGRQLSKKTKCSDRDKTKERLLPFCKGFVFWEELSVLLLWLTKKQLEKITSLKQQLPKGFTSEYFQALGFGHILFYNKRVGKHNTRSGQCETCIWRTHYHKGIFSRFSARKFCFTRTWLGEKNWLTRMTKTVIRNCVSEVYRGIPEDFFPMLYDLCLVISASTHPQGVTADRQNGCLSIPRLSPPQKTSEPSWPVVASNTFHHTMRCKTIMT